MGPTLGFAAQSHPLRYNGYDSEDSEYSGNNRRLSLSNQARGTSRGRGRGLGPRSQRHQSPPQSRNTGSEDNDDPNDSYALNRDRKEIICKNINIKEFCPHDKSTDFVIWVEQFEERVNRANNPHSQRRHHKYCLQWLPTCLSADAYTTWNDCKLKKADWLKVKEYLTDKFEDPAIRAKWTSDMGAYMWDEQKVPIQMYYTKVKRFVVKFDPEIVKCPGSLEQQYYTRFLCGLPKDYQDQIKMGISAKKATIDKALDIVIRYQLVKKPTEPKSQEVGGAVSFQDQTLPARITTQETDIVRLKNEVKDLRKDNQMLKAKQGQLEQNQQSNPLTMHAGSTPYRNGSAGWKNGDRGRSAERMQDRLNRFSKFNKNGRNNYQPRPHSNSRNFQQNLNQNQNYVADSASMHSAGATV